MRQFISRDILKYIPFFTDGHIRDIIFINGKYHIKILIVLFLIVVLVYINNQHKEHAGTINSYYYDACGNRYTQGLCRDSYYDLATRETLDSNNNWNKTGPVGEQIKNWGCGSENNCGHRYNGAFWSQDWTDDGCNCLCNPIPTPTTTESPIPTTAPTTTAPTAMTLVKIPLLQPTH